MTQSTHGEERLFDNSPYLKLVVDKEGRWFQNGAEIIHREVYLTFCRALETTADGHYQIRIGNEICRVEVEDTPFVVRRILEGEDGRLQMLLNDESIEPFDPRGFWIGDDNVPYADVKQSRFHARLLRPAYYELAKHIGMDDDESAFFFVDGMRVPIRRKTRGQPSPNGQ